MSLLGALLERRNSKPISLLICGGSALIAAGFVPCATKDVDILALFDINNTLIPAEPMPRILIDAALLVADELNLPTQWLNNGPRSIVNTHLRNNGLPEGLQNRLIKRHYGTVLTVYLIGRLDQIHFKVYAAADKGGPSYHLDDLFALCPTDDELLAAARWSMMQDPTPEFADIIKEMLRSIGHGKIADKL